MAQRMAQWHRGWHRRRTIKPQNANGKLAERVLILILHIISKWCQATSAPRYFQPADLNSITSFPMDSASDNPSFGCQFGVLKIQFWCDASPSFVDDRHRRLARGIFSAMCCRNLVFPVSRSPFCLHHSL